MLLDAALMGLLGAVIGSFLTVVVVRLPAMLARRWESPDADPSLPPRYNLAVPGSRAPCCGQPLRWYQNIPLLSYAWQGGRCTYCGQRMAWLYPALELGCALMFALCAVRFGLSAAALCWAGFCAALLALAWIDAQTTLLPDDITLPLLWAGLVAAALGWSGTPLIQALWGAVAGYLSLWLVYWGFKLITGKEGMGYGDFKLFAALGAWFGWPMLVPLILLASITGAAVGLGLKFGGHLQASGIIPFGPFLSGAGLLAVALGPATLLRSMGL